MMKKSLSIISFSIFLLFVSSIYSSCYATPSTLTPEQIESETASLKIFQQKLKVTLDLTSFITRTLDKPYSNDEAEQKLISDLYKSDELLSKLLMRDLPIPNTTIERKRIFISCFSTLDDICINAKRLSKETIKYRQNRTSENRKRCDDTLLEVNRNINILKARLETLN